MKLFTVKDFIKYNSPCFYCNTQIMFVLLDLWDLNGQPEKGTIHPVIFPTYTSIPLEITYRNRLILHIHHKNNRIETNDIDLLKNFFGKHTIVLKSICDQCHTNIFSNPMEIDYDKMYVKPVSLRVEKIEFKDDKYFYSVRTDYLENNTVITVSSRSTTQQHIFKSSLHPLFKFKTKEKLMEKIRTYMLFS